MHLPDLLINYSVIQRYRSAKGAADSITTGSVWHCRYFCKQQLLNKEVGLEFPTELSSGFERLVV